MNFLFHSNFRNNSEHTLNVVIILFHKCHSCRITHDGSFFNCIFNSAAKKLTWHIICVLVPDRQWSHKTRPLKTFWFHVTKRTDCTTKNWKKFSMGTVSSSKSHFTCESFCKLKIEKRTSVAYFDWINVSNMIIKIFLEPHEQFEINFPISSLSSNIAMAHKGTFKWLSQKKLENEGKVLIWDAILGDQY